MADVSSGKKERNSPVAEDIQLTHRMHFRMLASTRYALLMSHTCTAGTSANAEQSSVSATAVLYTSCTIQFCLSVEDTSQAAGCPRPQASLAKWQVKFLRLS